MPDQPPPSRTLGYMLALSQVGMEMVVPIIVGILLDQWLRTVPWLMVAGIMLGLVGGPLHMLAILKKMEQAESQQPPQDPT